ncbi:hypothetical protein BDR07DRAFT_1383456 [Suillus spraguei]|nr:hypothetical protein BDR03DRAFT_882499 [Suillus americanus]KAG2028883.1 hypothetical protein BDR03DRAFT_882472 [Suillus americanus]KAG2028889.1 hypothetical protein BDR03DRAFT_882434 [Suillus americanus]KAG2353139.1 hypothetical protein BDR07DRAFT_1383456 [Suillus spraguei]
MADPNNEICPDFASAAYAEIREDLIRASGQTEAQVTNRMVVSWTQSHRQRVDDWNQEREQEEHEAAEAAQARAAQEEEVRERQEADAEKERLEAEKKKPKMNGFNATLTVGDFITPRPAQYAISKINNFEYTELWYFSPDGCKDAQRSSQSTAEDGYGLTQVDNAVLALRPLSAFKASKSAIPDHELTFLTFLRAKNTFLTHISKAKWPQANIDALSLFFWHLENHPIRNNSDIGDLVVLHYASRVRQDWHDRLKRDEAFNIGVLNENLIRSINDELWDKVRSAKMSQVGFNQSEYRIYANTINTFPRSNASNHTSLS